MHETPFNHFDAKKLKNFYKHLHIFRFLILIGFQRLYHGETQNMRLSNSSKGKKKNFFCEKKKISIQAVG